MYSAETLRWWGREGAGKVPARHSAAGSGGPAVAAASPEPGGRMPAPVEYAAAVDRYLGQACLGPASRRAYRISLAAWACPLVGERAPHGDRRRGAAPPVVPLALLDDQATGARLAAALA